MTHSQKHMGVSFLRVRLILWIFRKPSSSSSSFCFFWGGPILKKTTHSVKYFDLFLGMQGLTRAHAKLLDPLGAPLLSGHEPLGSC